MLLKVRLITSNWKAGWWQQQRSGMATGGSWWSGDILLGHMAGLAGITQIHEGLATQSPGGHWWSFQLVVVEDGTPGGAHLSQAPYPTALWG